MKPGRELDALVAGKVMGHECLCDEGPIDCPVHACGDHDVLRAYSTDIAAAWTVDRPGWLWEFQETERTLTVTLYMSPEVLLESVRNRDFALPEQTVLIRREWLGDKAATYAWLRCLAALEAAGVEVGS